MFHLRQWIITDCNSKSELAAAIRKPQSSTFGMRFNGVLYLNDSTDAGIAEYAVIDEGRGIQVDSWTTEWMTSKEVEDSIMDLQAEKDTLKAFPTDIPFQPELVWDKPPF